MLIGGDIKQRFLMFHLHTPILRGGSEENLLLQLRRRPRVLLLHRALKRNVRNVEPAHISNIFPQRLVAVDVVPK